jgi:hypothetical protein
MSPVTVEQEVPTKFVYAPNVASLVTVTPPPDVAATLLAGLELYRSHPKRAATAAQPTPLTPSIVDEPAEVLFSAEH